MLILFLVTLLSQLLVTRSIICSKSPPIHHKQTLTRDRVTKEEKPQTLVTISLGLKETACFSIRDTWQQKGEVYGISLDDVKSLLHYKNQYTFGIPKTDVKCICDCPGAEDFCNPNTNTCKDSGLHEDHCLNWYEDNLSTPGCASFLSGSSQVCCSIYVYPANKTQWRAIELGNGANRAVFTVTKLSNKESTTTEVDIEGGHPILEPFYLTINAPAIESSLYPGWYFGLLTGDKLYGGMQINGLSEFDTEKLGWYKYIRTGNSGGYEMDKNEILESFKVNVDNCDKDDLNVQFNNKYTNEQFDRRNELNHIYKASLSKIIRMDNERRIETYFRQYSNIDITITLDGDYEVVQEFDISHFADFDGAVMMDKHSNYFINVTIYDGRGSITGNLTVDNSEDVTEDSSDVIKINMDAHKEVARESYIIRVSAICKDDEKATLCLYTDTVPGNKRCKTVMCDRKPMEEFELPDSTIDYEKGDKMSIFSPSTWAKHLNPAEWFNGISNWKEGVIMVTEIVGVLTVIGIILKVLKVLGILQKCCKCVCCWKRNKKGKSSKEKGNLLSSYRFKSSDNPGRERKRLISELLDQFSHNEGSTVHLNRSYRHRSQSSESSPSYMVSTPRYHDMEQDHHEFQYPPDQFERSMCQEQPLTSFHQDPRNQEQPQTIFHKDPRFMNDQRGNNMMSSFQNIPSSMANCNTISRCNNMQSSCNNIASCQKFSSCNNIQTFHNNYNNSSNSSSNNSSPCNKFSSGSKFPIPINHNGNNTISSCQNIMNNPMNNSTNMLNYNNNSLNNISKPNTLTKSRPTPPPVPARARTLPVGTPLPGFSTPGPGRKSSTLPGGTPVPGFSTPGPGRKSSTLPNNIISNSSNTLPNKFNPLMTPPMSRVGTAPRIFDRNGRRHTVQHAPGSPSLARVFVRPQHLVEQEMEVFNSSTDSLLGNHQQRGDNGGRDQVVAAFRKGHSRNGSRVLLLKNSDV